MSNVVMRLALTVSERYYTEWNATMRSAYPE